MIGLGDVYFPNSIDRKLGEAASLVDCTMESLDGNDTEYNEEEHHEDESVSKLRQTPEHDSDKPPHAWHPLD